MSYLLAPKNGGLNMMRILLLGVLLSITTPAAPASAMCGFWTNCPATNTWRYDQTICSDNPKDGYSTVFVRCYAPEPAPTVVYVSPPRTRVYYTDPYYRPELNRYRSYRSPRCDNDAYYHRHPKAAEARAEHRERLYHRAQHRMRRQ